MSVLTGFFIFIMLVLLGYSIYRACLRRQLLMLIVVCAQLFALSIALMCFFYDLQGTNLMEACFLLLGIVFPGGFLFYDCKRLIRRFKRHAEYSGLVERKPRPQEISGAVPDSGDGPDEDPGRKLVRQGLYMEAADFYKRSASKNPGDHRNYANLAGIYAKIGDWHNAVECYRKAVEIHKESHQLYYNLAVALDELGRREDAAKAFENAIKLNPDFVEAYNNLGVTLAAMDKYEDAVEVYKRGLALNPAHYNLLFNLGVALSECRKFEAAVASFEKALHLDSTDDVILYHLGAALTELGRYDQAVGYYKRALKSKPEDSDIYYSIAVAYSWMKKSEISLDNLKKAVELNVELKAEARKERAFAPVRNHKRFKEMVS